MNKTEKKAMKNYKQRWLDLLRENFKEGDMVSVEYFDITYQDNSDPRENFSFIFDVMGRFSHVSNRGDFVVTTEFCYNDVDERASYAFPIGVIEAVHNLNTDRIIFPDGTIWNGDYDEVE